MFEAAFARYRILVSEGQMGGTPDHEAALERAEREIGVSALLGRVWLGHAHRFLDDPSTSPFWPYLCFVTDAAQGRVGVMKKRFLRMSEQGRYFSQEDDQWIQFVRNCPPESLPSSFERCLSAYFAYYHVRPLWSADLVTLVERTMSMCLSPVDLARLRLYYGMGEAVGAPTESLKELAARSSLSSKQLHQVFVQALQVFDQVYRCGAPVVMPDPLVHRVQTQIWHTGLSVSLDACTSSPKTRSFLLRPL